MKKIVITCSLALSACASLIIGSKVDASSNTKYSIKNYNKAKKYSHGMEATFSYQLPQLKGNSTAVKKINSSLRKNYVAEEKNSRTAFSTAKSDSNDGFSNLIYFDTTKTKITYNKKNVISIKSTTEYWFGERLRITVYGWTYSLKSGKRLSVYDVAQGSQVNIKDQVLKGINKFNAYSDYFAEHDLNKLDFFLQKGKVYVYPHVNYMMYYEHFTLPSRYK